MHENRSDMHASRAGRLVARTGNSLRQDVPAGVVVFLVALPLCLGIALGSGAPLFGGVIAGIVGGLVVGALSGSPVSVSGPTATLALVVFNGIHGLGSYEKVLVAVVLAGAFQIVFGALKLGLIADYIPNSVIKGMLAGIGIVIVLKQIPHALGWDRDYEGDFRFLEFGGNNMFSDIAKAIASASPGAVIVFVVGLGVLLLWPVLAARFRVFQLAPAPLVVVVMGIALNGLFGTIAPSLQLVDPNHLVNLPAPASVSSFIAQFAFPDFSVIRHGAVWTLAASIAVMATLETLLALETADRLDPYKRISSSNRELFAQGVGNIVSGFAGGLPLTSVVVRTAVNVEAGGRTRRAAMAHGALLLIAVVLLPRLLRLTPLASLATVLVVVGFKLTRPSLYRAVYAQGWSQFLPFLVTTVAIVFSGLLTGVLLGSIFGIFFVIRTNHHEAITVVNQDSDYLFRFTKDASFINKNEFRRKLRALPDDCHVLIDGARALFIDHDIMEIAQDFRQLAPHKNIQVEVKEFGA